MLAHVDTCSQLLAEALARGMAAWQLLARLLCQDVRQQIQDVVQLSTMQQLASWLQVTYFKKLSKALRPGFPKTLPRAQWATEEVQTEVGDQILQKLAEVEVARGTHVQMWKCRCSEAAPCCPQAQLGRTALHGVLP